MWVAELADDGILQLFDCLGIVGIDGFIEEAPKKCKELISSEIGTHCSTLFQRKWTVMETTLQLSQVAFEHDTSD